MYAIALLFSLLVLPSSAHLPVFPTSTEASKPYKLEAINTKSYGVYGELKSEDIVWLEVEAEKGWDLTVSLQRNKVEAVYDVAIWGPSLNNVSCGNENWFGWAHSIGNKHHFTRNLTDLPPSVLSAIGSSEGFALHGDGSEPSHFEAFGVGVYWPLAGCRDTFPATGTYYMALVNPKEDTVSFSLGVGIEESFTVLELLLMPFVILDTFVWSGRSLETVLGIFLISTALVYTFKIASLQRNSYTLLTRTVAQTIRTVTLHLIWVCAAAFFSSGISFVFQLVYSFSLKPDLGGMIWVPLLVHIFIPILISLLVLFFYDPRLTIWWKLLFLFGGLYMLFLGWFSFLVFPVLYLLSLIIQLLLGP